MKMFFSSVNAVSAFMLAAILVSLGPGAQAMTIDELHLDRFEDYPLDHAGQPTRFFLTSNSKEASRVVFISTLKPSTEASSRTDITAEIQCDDDFVFHQKFLLSRDGSVKSKSFVLYQGDGASVTVSPQVGDCILKFWDETNKQRQGAVKLIRENKAFPFLVNLNESRQTCNYQPSVSLPVDSAFLTGDFKNMTCAQAADKIETLETPESGFTAKVEALLGSRLEPEFIKNQNPYAPLDLSRAPRLDAVFVASLVFRHDFYGTVITRLLKLHADRGTLVNVMTTGYMQSDKDRALLYEAARENGNFRFQEYKFSDPEKGLKSPGRLIDNKFRDMHIKLFVTLSHLKPEDNILVLGGRNIHDGFLFSEKPDHSKFPELTQYGKDENFVHWNDFEIRIQSAVLARSIYSHLLTFRNRDTLTQAMDSINTPADASPEISGAEILRSTKPMMRHIISLPYADGHALEKLFVNMIDSAQQTIQISSPYLRPTPEISKALERAAGRNVKITIQTRIDLAGDTSPWLYTEVNKESINKFLDKAQIYEWTQNSILHSKFLLVDGKLAFIGSVNLSRRSFIHDVENGFMIRNDAFVKRMQTIFAGYNSRSRLITEQQSRKFWGSLVVGILKDQF